MGKLANNPIKNILLGYIPWGTEREYTVNCNYIGICIYMAYFRFQYYLGRICTVPLNTVQPGKCIFDIRFCIHSVLLRYISSQVQVLYTLDMYINANILQYICRFYFFQSKYMCALALFCVFFSLFFLQLHQKEESRLIKERERETQIKVFQLCIVVVLFQIKKK